MIWQDVAFLLIGIFSLAACLLLMNEGAHLNGTASKRARFAIWTFTTAFGALGLAQLSNVTGGQYTREFFIAGNAAMLTAIFLAGWELRRWRIGRGIRKNKA